MINAKIEFHKRVPKIGFQRDLMNIAKQIIIPDMQRGIFEGINIDDRQFPPNEANTIKKKGHGQVLVDKKKLYNSFKAMAKGKYKVMIDLASDRALIGKYLQIDGIRSKTRGLKKYKFFGISKGAESKSFQYMRNRIKEAIRNA